MKFSYIIYTLFAIVVLYLVILYFTLRSSIIGVTHTKPYAELIGHNVVLDRAVYIAKNLPEFSIKEACFLTEDTVLFEGVSRLAVIEAGSILELKGAYHQNNRVSGSKTSLVVGIVYVEKLKESIPFEYVWGEYHGFCLGLPCDYWTFPKAIWQNTEDLNKYFID